MKTNFLLCLLSGLAVMSCSPGDSTSIVIPVTQPQQVAPSENISALTQQFHGKYKLLSSISDQPVDVNLDGKATTNLRDEIADLTLQEGTQYHVDVRVYAPTTQVPAAGFLFLQWWPEQFIRTGPGKTWDGSELISYNPAYSVGYDFQGGARSFSFSADLKQLNVKPSEPENPHRWVRPESVTVKDNGQLEVITKRRLYTREGVKDVTITSVYERYTMKT
jgi:hypothetical protein